MDNFFAIVCAIILYTIFVVHLDNETWRNNVIKKGYAEYRLDAPDDNSKAVFHWKKLK